MSGSDSQLACAWTDGVVLLRTTRNTATPEAVRDLEAAVGWAMPPGYEEYVTRLGEGSY